MNPLAKRNFLGQYPEKIKMGPLVGENNLGKNSLISGWGPGPLFHRTKYKSRCQASGLMPSQAGEGEGSSSLHVCCFDENLSRPVCLVRNVVDNDCVVSSCYRLEDALERRLDDDTGGLTTQGDPEPLPPLRYYPRPDVSWLDCQRPTLATKETILGLLEEDDAQPRDVPIEMRVWTARTSQEKESCNCQAPSRKWIRSSLDHVATPPPLSTAIISQPPSQLPPPECKKVAWLDFRQVPTFSLLTPASCTHFLRSLLGSALDASPWINRSGDGLNSSISGADCVVIAFSGRAPDALLDFRVSDASPSWSLYSVARTHLPLTHSGDAILPWVQSDDSPACDLRPADLLVYRRLNPRHRLSSLHPVLNEKAIDGCLWQTRVLYHVSEDGTEDTDKPYLDYRLVAPPYINPTEEFPQLQKLISPENLETIQKEALRIPQWTAWPETTHYKMKRSGIGDDDSGSPPWHVFPICYCFPANEVGNRKWIPLTAGFVPKTTALLKDTLGDSLRTALFSRLDPGAVLEAHTGWEDLANHVYRVHLPLQVPSGGLCGTWADGCVETHEVGLLQAFDDSKIHRAFNYSAEDRVVLILDLARPPTLPRGTATGGHTDELDKFIEQMGGAQ